MKEVSVDTIAREIARMSIEAACDLPKDVEAALRAAAEREESAFGK